MSEETSRFPTTRASAVLGAASENAEEREQSLERIAAAYWKPVYKYTRVRFRRSPEEATEITQEFFARALEKELFGAWQKDRARFRTFLRACLERFVVDGIRRDGAEKRGGKARRLDVDFADAEEEIAGMNELGGEPAEYFDAEWTRHLLGTSVDALRAVCEARGKQEHFRVFERIHLADADPPPTYAEVAAALSISVSDVTNRLAFARRELRRIVLETLREITSSEDEFRSEARAVLGVSA